KVYLITGCSSGLGYEIAITALKAGHKVIATSRNPSKTPDKVQQITNLGGQWAALNVSSPTLEAQFHNTILPLLPNGRLDTLINNAGIAVGSVVEDIHMDAARDILETNFWGTMRLSRLAVPIMRAKGGGGNIVNISSSNALLPLPMLSIYAASKSAIDSFSLSLAGEVAQFGIRVMVVSPAGMRTSFVQNGEDQSQAGKDLREEYKGTSVEAVMHAITDLGNFKVDPVRAAAVIVAAIDGTGVFEGVPKDFFRLPIGAQSIDALEMRIGELKGCLEGLSAVANSVD
ncbi:NAD(P)-binding protein, partial [Cryphonectria parasitica EP155]